MKPKLSDLPVQERLKIVQDLWDSIEAETAAVEVDPDHIAELRKRLAAYHADPVIGERARDVAESIRRSL